MRLVLRNYVRSLPVNTWVYFEELPDHIFFPELWDAIERGSEIRELHTTFNTCSSSPPEVVLHDDWSGFMIKKEYVKVVNGFYYDHINSYNFKKELI